ncbi:uncharacterized protein ATNIH1004_008201 [Aspergillus tanneri]|uniref:Uncharacterized protein n=1 Tax=Aspergillus tanneri TaxID=1220188 RepID=A0A5M9MAE0_9EURO|nr:uncharacterized protein ATNIH1004_008201 [Aspergillus tanneri]KAA8644005.1 hypothetical protein ATNIH1004_008201 [Aspergillus tanneri]
MRENLINREFCFDHSEFVRDLVGDLIDGKKYSSSRLAQSGSVTGKLTLSEGDDDEITATRQGLIVWGEPYLTKNWEATPGFLRKWSWAMHGCDELIDSTNNWRIIRGEKPVRLSCK